MSVRSLVSGLILSVALAVPAAVAETYKIDEGHSSVTFSIRHILSAVRGSFNAFNGSFVYEPGTPEAWTVTATIDPASIDTNVEKRDAHLRNPDFFDTAKYPAITFKSAQVTDATDTTAKLHGILNMHGVEKPVVLDLKLHGVAKDPWGNQRAAFTATTKLNRKDFGLNWNQALETGQLLVGEDVEITIDIEGIAQPS